MLRQSAPCSRRLPPLRFGSPLLQAAICMRLTYDLAPLRFGRTQCASATPARYARCGCRRTLLPAYASLMIQPRYTSAVRCARLESHRASLGVTLDAHSYLPALHSLRPSHPNPHPLPQPLALPEGCLRAQPARSHCESPHFGKPPSWLSQSVRAGRADRLGQYLSAPALKEPLRALRCSPGPLKGFPLTQMSNLACH